jgi:hypothetical protein
MLHQIGVSACFQKSARIRAPSVVVETDRAILSESGAAEQFLVDSVGRFGLASGTCTGDPDQEIDVFPWPSLSLAAQARGYGMSQTKLSRKLRELSRGGD